MTRWAQTVVARKWWVLSLAVLIVLISGVWGLGVFGKLSQGGFIDPGSDSAKVADIIEDNLGRRPRTSSRSTHPQTVRPSTTSGRQ